MRVAIACDQNRPDCTVESHFGKASWIYVCDTKSKGYFFIENPTIERKLGSGCYVAKKLVEQKVEMVIAKSFNIKVSGYFKDHSVQMVTPHVDIKADKLIDQIACF